MAIWQYDLFFIGEGDARPLLTDDGWDIPSLSGRTQSFVIIRDIFLLVTCYAIRYRPSSAKRGRVTKGLRV